MLQTCGEEILNIYCIHETQSRVHRLGMCIIQGKNSTRWAPGWAAVVTWATNSLMFAIEGSLFDSMGGVPYTMDMITDAAARQRCWSQQIGSVAIPWTRRMASVVWVLWYFLTTFLLNPPCAALRMQRQLFWSICNKLEIEREKSYMPL